MANYACAMVEVQHTRILSQPLLQRLPANESVLLVHNYLLRPRPLQVEIQDSYARPLGKLAIFACALEENEALSHAQA